jgi:mannose-6-phosphate isomerase-like protein (cupin superfamily)
MSATEATIINIEELPDASVSHDADVKKKVVHRNGDIPHLMQFAQSTLKPGQKATKHVHKDMTEVFHVKSGQAEFDLNDKITIVKEGGVVTIPPGVYHEIRNAFQQDLVLLYFGIQH